MQCLIVVFPDHTHLRFYTHTFKQTHMRIRNRFTAPEFQRKYVEKFKQKRGKGSLFRLSKKNLYFFVL